ncbi:RDD family protein [compost metagenome]
MKTWRLRLVTRSGEPLEWRHALKRFLIALPGTLLLGAGFLWALVDREGLFLHDRLAGTKIVRDDL